MKPPRKSKTRKQALYSELAEYYDKIYWWKDYEKEVKFLEKILRKHDVRGNEILEVACGTGNHTKILTGLGYEVTGVDVSEDVLAIARRKVKHGATFVQGDMRNLGASVKGKFDAVICLFSAISYNLNREELLETLEGFYEHLRKGGVAIFDTHFTKRSFVSGYRGEDIFDDGKTIGARLSKSTRKNDLGEISFTYLIKDGKKVILLRNDIHRLGLFDPDDLVESMRDAGFKKVKAFIGWTGKSSARKSLENENVIVGVRS